METLQKKWDEGKRDAMIELVKKIETLKDEDQIELADILDAHFDPEKKPIRPIVQRRENANNNQMGRRRRNGGNRNSRGNNMNNKENNQDRARSNSRRRRRSSTDNKRFGGANNNNNSNAKNNNNNNNVMDSKTGAIRKDSQQAVDANGNMLATAY